MNNHVTDLVVSNFENKLFVSVTQFGKVGSLVSVKVMPLVAFNWPLQVLVRRDVNLNEDSSPVYSIKSLLGKDQAEYHILARHLYERLQLKKQLLFGFALHSFAKKDLAAVEEFICVTIKQLNL